MNLSLVKRIIGWSLLAVTLVYIITGLGITHYRNIEPLTFGLLGKNLSFRIHEVLLIPFSTLLALHVLFRMVSWIYFGLKGKNKAQ